jgi:hypothetical protein
MIKKILLLFLIAQSSLMAISQEKAYIFGTVVNEHKAALDGIVVLLLEDSTLGAITDSNGFFKLVVPANQKFTMQFKSSKVLPYSMNIRKLLSNDTLNFRTTLEENGMGILLKDISINGHRDKDNDIIIFTPIENFVNINGGVESMIKIFGVHTIGGELSSAYSVRGGSFDENLVYVNDFEVYRPYLVRSGQQEGLTFANPELIQNLKFSAGGFQARYGDKMSSVLDITYKKPRSFGGSIAGSLLGYSAHLEGASKDSNFTALVGFRQKSNGYLLRSLQTKGQYSPSFYDVQTYMTYKVGAKHFFELMANYAYNDYRFQPVNRKTDFGLANYTVRLQMAFDGQEHDKYQNIMGGLAYTLSPKPKLKLKFMASGYRTSEREAYDITGSYFIGEVETDITKSNFNQIKYGLGTGETQDWARNELYTTIYNVKHIGTLYAKNNVINWSLSYKHESIDDQLKEWGRKDSAGYTLPYSFTEVNIASYLKSAFKLESNRYEGHLQNTWRSMGHNKWTITGGVRFHIWDVNKEFLVSPRLQVSVRPYTKNNKNLSFNFATGLYQQAPFYREMRRIDGSVNLDLKAQKSYHAVLGFDYEFAGWHRPFKFSTDLYYKYMWDLVPYELDNTLIRYFGTNNSVGYAYGIDLRLNGELAKGDESWMSLSLINTRENILDDHYKEYYDTAGRKTYPQYYGQNAAVDSAEVFPGYIPRPTDQRVSFSLFFQDHIPRLPELKVNIGLDFATGLPFGAPDNSKNTDTLRIPSYKRVDMGFSGMLYNNEWKNHHINKTVFKHLKSIWMSFEIFNVLGINNTVSYLWVKDFNNSNYAVPNYLSNRRINVRLVVKF